MRIIKIIICCLIALGLTACSQSNNIVKKNATNENQVTTKYDRDSSHGEIAYITLEEMEEKIADKESFSVMFSTTYCLYCRDFHSVFDEYIKTHHVVMYEVVLDNENRTEQENLEIIKKYFPEFSTTPGIFYVEKGKEKNYLNFSKTGMNEKAIDEWVQKYKLDKK